MLLVVLAFVELFTSELSNSPAESIRVSVGTGSSGHRSPGQLFWPGRVGSRVSVTDPLSDPVM